MQINLSQEKTEDKKLIQISKTTQKVLEEFKKLQNISPLQELDQTRETKEIRQTEAGGDIPMEPDHPINTPL